MTGDNQENDTNESARPRKKGNEQAIKDFVVAIGSLMMLMCFGLLLDVNARAWHKGKLDHKYAAIGMFVGFCAVTFLFGLYIFWRIKSCSSEVDEESLDETIVSLFIDSMIACINEVRHELHGIESRALYQSKKCKARAALKIYR